MPSIFDVISAVVFVGLPVLVAFIFIGRSTAKKPHEDFRDTEYRISFPGGRPLQGVLQGFFGFNDAPMPRVACLKVRSGELVDGITFEYTDDTSLAFGGDGGTEQSFALDHEGGEHLVRIKVRCGDYVDAVRFLTSTGRQSPWYGREEHGRELVFQLDDTTEDNSALPPIFGLAVTTSKRGWLGHVWQVLSAGQVQEMVHCPGAVEARQQIAHTLIHGALQVYSNMNTLWMAALCVTLYISARVSPIALQHLHGPLDVDVDFNSTFGAAGLYEGALVAVDYNVTTDASEGIWSDEWSDFEWYRPGVMLEDLFTQWNANAPLQRWVVVPTSASKKAALLVHDRWIEPLPTSAASTEVNTPPSVDGFQYVGFLKPLEPILHQLEPDQSGNQREASQLSHALRRVFRKLWPRDATDVWKRAANGEYLQEFRVRNWLAQQSGSIDVQWYLDTGCWSSFEVYSSLIIFGSLSVFLAVKLAMSVNRQRHLQAYFHDVCCSAEGEFEWPPNRADPTSTDPILRAALASYLPWPGRSDAVERSNDMSLLAQRIQAVSTTPSPNDITTAAARRRQRHQLLIDTVDFLPWTPERHQWELQRRAAANVAGAQADAPINDAMNALEETLCRQMSSLIREEQRLDAASGPRYENRTDRSQASLVRSIESEISIAAATSGSSSNSLFHHNNVVAVGWWLIITHSFSLSTIATHDLQVLRRSRPLRQRVHGETVEIIVQSVASSRMPYNNAAGAPPNGLRVLYGRTRFSLPAEHHRTLHHRFLSRARAAAQAIQRQQQNAFFAQLQQHLQHLLQEDVVHRLPPATEHSVNTNRASSAEEPEGTGWGDDDGLCLGGCGKRADIKIVKRCGTCPERDVCSCAPGWCHDCMFKWWLSRNSTRIEMNQALSMAWQARCPTCRSYFCLSDCVPVVTSEGRAVGSFVAQPSNPSAADQDSNTATPSSVTPSPINETNDQRAAAPARDEGKQSDDDDEEATRRAIQRLQEHTAQLRRRHAAQQQNPQADSPAGAGAGARAGAGAGAGAETSSEAAPPSAQIRDAAWLREQRLRHLR